MSWPMVAVIVVAAALVVFFGFAWMMARVMKSDAKNPSDDARTILENRFALGEIDDAEFSHRMQMINDERRRAVAPRREGVS